MYLGGNYVRVVCERVRRIAQDCAKKQELAGGSRLASREKVAHMPSMPEAEASRQLFTKGQKSRANQVICLWQIGRAHV